MSEGLRPPREEDLPEVTRLMAVHWPEPVDEETVRRDWTSPRVDLDHDARLGEGCYCLVEPLGEERVWLDVRGAPTTELLDWAETRATEVGSRILSGSWSTNETLLRELERRGFELVRHSQRMEIDLRQPTREPDWPAGIELRTFREGDERAVYETEHEAFRDSWEPEDETFEEWSHWMLEPPAFAPDLWLLAWGGESLAGVALCHAHPGRSELGWIRVVGVRRHWRRRGLGTALLLHAFAALRERGFAHAGLGVDAASPTGANRLYENAGMHVVARFDVYEKPA